MPNSGLVKILLLAVALDSGFVALTIAQSVIAPVAPPGGTFDERTIVRGAQLAAIGGCAGCHTVPGRAPYAGGVPLKTPFGTLYGTNITPDSATGIGQWSEADFIRAMREGIARDGSHLYPAFPYAHFTRTSGEDLHALYAYLMTRAPVDAQPPANDLRFPFNLRGLIRVWNRLYLDKTPSGADNSRDAEWNRGAYLVNSLGHCSACHSPRNFLGAENRQAYLGGGEAEGWYAPPLNERSPSPLPWTVDTLTQYLSTGMADGHAIAGGPMQDVVFNLAQAPAADVRAIAVYVLSTLGDVTPARETLAKSARERAANGFAAVNAATGENSDSDLQLGAAVYAGACASCHDQGRGVSSADALQLPLAIALYDADPRSLIRIILDGITPPEGETSRWMPGFEGALTDEQVSALASYLRVRAAGQPPWPDIASKVSKARRG